MAKKTKKQVKIEELRKYLESDISSLADYAVDLQGLDLDEEDFDYSEIEDYASQIKELADALIENIQKLDELKS